MLIWCLQSGVAPDPRLQDLSRFASAKFQEQIQCWVDTLQLRVPGAKVIVCGTHADLLDPAVARERCERVAQQLHNRQTKLKKRLSASCQRAQRRIAELVGGPQTVPEAVAGVDEAENTRRGDIGGDAVAEANSLRQKLGVWEAQLQGMLVLPDRVLAVSSAAGLVGMDALVQVSFEGDVDAKAVWWK